MAETDTLEMLAFNLKLVGRKTKKNVLVSAGQASNKELLFPAIDRLSNLGDQIVGFTEIDAQ